jgi:hypothetical protein
MYLFFCLFAGAKAVAVVVMVMVDVLLFSIH